MCSSFWALCNLLRFFAVVAAPFEYFIKLFNFCTRQCRRVASVFLRPPPKIPTPWKAAVKWRWKTKNNKEKKRKKYMEKMKGKWAGQGKANQSEYWDIFHADSPLGSFRFRFWFVQKWFTLLVMCKTLPKLPLLLSRDFPAIFSSPACLCAIFPHTHTHIHSHNCYFCHIQLQHICTYIIYKSFSRFTP